jgi:hypothetical protein
VAVAAAVDPAGDRAVSRAVDRVASPAVSRKDGLAVSRVVGPVIAISADQRSVRRAVSQVDSEPISRAAKVAPLAMADQVCDAPPMIVRSALPVRWARPSPKKSTSPNSTRLF